MMVWCLKGRRGLEHKWDDDAAHPKAKWRERPVACVCGTRASVRGAECVARGVRKCEGGMVTLCAR